MTKTYCDLCCEEIKTGEKLRFFKIKEYGLFHELTWKKIDAHDECVKSEQRPGEKGQRHDGGKWQTIAQIMAKISKNAVCH